jgi:multisubunit Na+/H+ antiporter MnhF subunit
MQPDVLIITAVCMISAAFFIALIRVVWGPTFPDRVVGVDLIGVSAVCLMVVAAAGTKETTFLDAAVVITLLGFLGTVAYARYAQRRARD